MPIGVSSSLFKRLVQALAAAPEFEGCEALVIFGSRTHLRTGRPPDPESDLDVAVLFSPEVETKDAVRRIFRINRQVFQPFSEEAGFPILQQLMDGWPIDRYFGKGSLLNNGLTSGQELEIHTRLLEAQNGNMPDKDTFFQSLGSVTKDAVFVLFPSARREYLKAQLEAIGYSNVFSY